MPDTVYPSFKVYGPNAPSYAPFGSGPTQVKAWEMVAAGVTDASAVGLQQIVDQLSASGKGLQHGYDLLKDVPHRAVCCGGDVGVAWCLTTGAAPPAPGADRGALARPIGRAQTSPCRKQETR